MDANLLRYKQQQMNSSLMRYRSAPSSLIATLMEEEVEVEVEGCDDFIPSSTNYRHRSSSPEAETMFARFTTSCADSGSPDLREIQEKFPQANGRSTQYLNSIEQQHHGAEQSKYSSPTRGSQTIYQTLPTPSPPPQQQPHNSIVGKNGYRVANSMSPQQVKMSGSPSASIGGASSNLIRHSSSPAGFFSHLTVENGYAVMKGIVNPGSGNGTNGEVAASNSRLKGQINFNSGTPSTSGIMSQISEIGSESMGASSMDGGSLGNGNTSNHYMPNFPISSWDDSPLENFSGLKRARDSSGKMMSGLNLSDPQNREGENRPGLNHHYSLPKNSTEMAAILQFQDSVPCKIRAKRGCATHPRSIAERVRRTRISERMRKLQELVPNMDKQTNTADMLDLAVEYIKDLQKQVKTLNDSRANCTCSSMQKPYQNTRA